MIYITKTINITYETYLDLVNIREGVFHPLDRFMDYNDLSSVINANHLENGNVWPLPVIQTIDDAVFPEITEGEEYDLIFGDITIGSVSVDDKYKICKNKIADLVFKTSDRNHPGVNLLFDGPNYAISGKLRFYNGSFIKNADSGSANGSDSLFHHSFHLTPKETKQKFKEMGWRTIVGFQTRNVPHLAHEYLQRCGLEIADGLLLQPISGWKKIGDYRAEIVFECYKALIDNYYPKNRVLLCSLSTSMRYAGPREALFHAIIRRNYGCTHFIVGRDHAGVGNYYKKYEAHEIFDSVEDIGIIPMLLHEPFYCKRCNMMATEKTCSHNDSERTHMSGTYIRNLISNNESVPEKIMRKEVVDILNKHLNKSNSLFY